MTAGEVVLLADVVGDAVELLAAGVVGVDQLPRSLADGAVEADAGAAGVPDIGEVPDEGAVGGGVAGAQEEGHEADAVHGSGKAVGTDAGHLEDGGIEVLDDDVAVAARSRGDHAGPADDEGLAYAALVEGTLAAGEGRVLGVGLTVAPLRRGGHTAVVAHEKDDGVVGLAVGIQPRQEVAEALVHAFDEGGVGGVLGAEALTDVLVVETAVAVDGDVDSVVGHIEEEGLPVVLHGVEGVDGFLREGFGGEGAGAPVGVEVGDGERREGGVPSVAWP